jgi:Ala-tRNA(Pro) deacylase
MVPRWIREYLDDRHALYETIEHTETHSAQHLARVLHISGHRVAKVVAIRCDDRIVPLTLPAARRVDLADVRRWLHCRRLRLASERDLKVWFRPCEPGAAPPLRCWPDSDVLMDSWLDVEGDIYFEAGTHRDAIRMPFREWLRLVNPRIHPFTQPWNGGDHDGG